MGLRSFFLGDRSSDAWELPAGEPVEEYDPLNPPAESVFEQISGKVESHTGVSLSQSSHTERHGLAGLFGYVDQQQREVDLAWEALQDGRLTESEFGYAVGTYHDAENHKPGWKYLLGL